MAHEHDFLKVLEAQIDPNVKIAKILASLQGWKLGYTAFKGNVYTLSILPA